MSSYEERMPGAKDEDETLEKAERDWAMGKQSVAAISRLMGAPPQFPQRCKVLFVDDQSATMIGFSEEFGEEDEIVIRWDDGETETQKPEHLFVDVDEGARGRRRCSTPYRNGRCTCQRTTVACVCAPRGCTFSVLVRVCRVPTCVDWFVCAKCLPHFTQPELPNGMLTMVPSLAGMSGFSVRFADDDDRAIADNLRTLLRGTPKGAPKPNEEDPSN